jgi:CBS domain-containing protein
MDGVGGRVLEDDHPGRHLDVCLDQLENPAPARDERVPLDEAALDVLETAHRVEVVRLVVVERRRLPQPAEDGVGILSDVDVVRVVVDVARRAGRQPRPPR